MEARGAHSINQAVMGMVKLVNSDSLYFVHQTGKEDEAEVTYQYRKYGINAMVRAFFDDLPDHMARADLIISRAGAGSISEIIHHGKPSILIPYPHAADDHQRFNAKEVVDQGGAVMILDKDLTPECLKKVIENLKNNPEKRLSMARSAKEMDLPYPAGAIARTCISMAEKRGI